MASSIQLKRGTAAALHASNPVLLRGEPALEIDTNKIKYGDGVTPWRDLPYGNPAIEVVDGGESTAGAVPAVPGTFSPPTIEGLVLWLDGGNTDYTHVVKNRVSMWEDMSESDAKFVQSNRLNRPLATNQLSGRGVVTFDGENDALVGNLQLPGEFTLLVALRRRGTSTNGKIFAAYTADNSTELVLCGTETGSSVGVRFEEEYSATQPLDDLVPVVYTLQFGTDGLSTRLNGLSTQAAEGITVPVLTHMSIGGSRANFTEDNYSGDVAEVVLYEGVLSAADLVDAENYMMNRWGIIQVAHPLMDGMKAFWRLNEESGNRLDITEDEIPLTPTGAVGFAEGVIENAAELTGGNNYLQAPGDFALEGSFSISLWFKPEGVSGGSSSLVQNWAAGNASGQVLLGFGDEGEDSGVLFGRISTDDDTYTVSGGDLEDGLWHHVVLAYDTNENTLTLYHDAEQVSQIYTAGSFNAGNIPLRVGIGDQIASQNDFPFLADQLGFWDRALTLAEVQMLYNYELGKEDFTADVYGDNVSLLLHMDKPANASGGGGGGGGGDPYFNNVSLLLHMDGSNGSTTFTDSSANALTATVNGNAVISTAQSKFGGASGYFDGSADLAFVPSEETHFGVADFTIEFWLYATSSPQDNQVVVSLCLWPNTSGIVVHYTNDYIAAFTGGFAAYHAVPRGADNAWHHYAVVRTNGQIAIYVDGVLGTPTPSSFGTFDQAFTDGIQYIGRPSDVDSYKLHGYIDDLRITKGVARYTANFTPPTAPFPDSAGTSTDPNFNNVSLLLHMDGSNGSTTFTDSSPNALTVTANGGAQISTSQSKFGGASARFDGSGDYAVVVDSSPAIDFGDGDFTIEFWAFVTATSGTQVIWSRWNNNGDNKVQMYLVGDALYVNSPFSGYSAGTITQQQWHHIALCRASGNMAVYIDGIQTWTAVVGDSLTSTSSFVIGANDIGSGGANWFDGYIDELRIVKSVAVYTANFTPPTSPLSPYVTVPPQLLLHFDGSNGSTTFTDSSPNALTVTANGGAQISTSQSKFGSGSGAFDGDGDYLQFAYSNQFDFASTDWTIEFWAKFNDVSGSGGGGLFAVIDDTDAGFVIEKVPGSNSGDGNKLFFYSSPGTFIYGGGDAIRMDDTDAWYHCAITREGDTVRAFVNGVLQASGSCTPSLPDTSLWPPTIAAKYAGVNSLDGFMDDFRIVMGRARYTANFTPPTAPFPDAAGGGGSGPISTFIDTSKHNHELTAVGNAYLNLEDLKYGNASGEFAGGHCEIAMSPEFAFDDGDFTVEFWGKLNYAANSAVFSTASSTQEAGTYLIGFGSDPNMFGFCYDIENLTFASANIAVHYDEWAHYAFVRLDGTLKMYVDGDEVATANTNINLDGGTATTAVIGRRWTDEDDYYLDGLIDDFKITKGVARYIAEFNPPTKAFPDPVLVAPPPPVGDIYAENVTLLLKMDGANGSTTFTDNSYLQNTVTAEGNAAISTAQSKFGGASAVFDGASGYLRTTGFSSWQPGYDNAAFTIELWTYRNTSDTAVYFCKHGGVQAWNGTDGLALELFTLNDNTLGFGFYKNGNVFNLISSATVPLNAWAHLAAVYDGTTTKLFINGTLAASTAETYDQVTAADIIQISGEVNNTFVLNGYIDDLRITKGVARYTNNFTPPTAPFPSPFTPSPAATLLMHFDGSFDDVGKNGLSFTAAGGASVSTDQSKFGGSSAYFDGISGTSLSAPSSSDFAFDGDFTVEAWIYRTGNGTVFGGTAFAQIATALGNGDATGWTLFIANGTDLNFLGSTGGGWQVVVVGPATIPLYQWCHVAVTRSGQDIRIFLDGTETVTGTSSASIVGGTNLYVGSYPLINGYGQASFQGYIDELRIIKGAAVYTSNFTPPAEPFKATSEVTPTDVPGCDLWLDSTADILLNNGSITNWPDKSGKTRPATPADYAPAPTLAVGEGPLGQNVVRFTGDPNVLDVGHEFKLKNSSGFVLARHASDITGSPYGRFLSFQPANGFDYDQADGLSLSTNTNNPTGVGLYNNGLDVTHAMTHPIGWTLLSYTIDSSGLAKLRIDGTEVGSETFAGIANAAGGNLYIGHGGGLGFIEALKGDIAEIALFDHALGEAALVALERGVISRCLPPPDPTVLLLHFDGANGSTTFTDSSGNNLAVTANGTAAISTAQSKFGGASGYFDGDGDYLDIAETPVLAIGNTFTIEAWVYMTAAPEGSNARWLLDFRGSSTSNYVMGVLNSTPVLYLYANGADVTGNAEVTLNAWHHVAFVNDAGSITLYLDGVACGSGTVSMSQSDSQVRIAQRYNTEFAEYFGGYIDDLRITKGIARYTGNFTPPTEPFI